MNPRSGVEYWFARELQHVLEYAEWRNFSSVIEKAKEACKGSNIEVSEHFVDVNKSSPMPNGGIQKTDFNYIEFEAINYHLLERCKGEELRKKATIRKIPTVQREGKNIKLIAS